MASTSVTFVIPVKAVALRLTRQSALTILDGVGDDDSRHLEPLRVAVQRPGL